MATRQQCIYIDNCPMVRYFNRMAQIVYQDMYCHRSYTECVRYRLKAAELVAKQKKLPPLAPSLNDDQPPPPPERWHH